MDSKYQLSNIYIPILTESIKITIYQVYQILNNGA